MNITPCFMFYKANVHLKSKRFLSVKQKRDLFVTHAKEAIFTVTGVSFEQMNTNNRSRLIVYPRFMLFALLNRNSKMNYKEIGGLFHRPS